MIFEQPKHYNFGLDFLGSCGADQTPLAAPTKGIGVLTPVSLSRCQIFCWMGVTGLFLGSHLALFSAQLLESWYGPLHLLWVVGCSQLLCCHWFHSAKSPLVWFLWLLTYVTTWLASELTWGSPVTGQSVLPLAGAFVLIFAAAQFVYLLLRRNQSTDSADTGITPAAISESAE